MKNILKKILVFLQEKNNMLITIVVVFIILLCSIVYFQHKKIINLDNKYQTEVKLKNALLDTVHSYKNKENEWVSEKLTIQETIKNLENDNTQLTQSQKELINRVKEVEKKNDIIAAALIESHVKIDSLLHKGETIVDTINKKIIFSDKYKNGKSEINYKFTIGNVLPAHINIKPTLFIDSIYLPNNQFVEFHWKKDKKTGYPISFSVSNSNDYFKTVNIDSYAIPELSKEKVNPNGWQKIQNFFIGNSKIVMSVGIGVVGGITAVRLLSK